MDPGLIVSLSLGLLTVGSILGILWFIKSMWSKAGLLHDKMLQGPSFTGSALLGTARVVSLQSTGMSIERSGHPPAYRCQIGLQVELPGSPPYDATVSQFVGMFSMSALERGARVPVHVDSANPYNVRVDCSQLPGLPASP